MKIIVWNCQGAASKRFLRAAKSIVNNHKPECLCILEPKTSGTNADDICFKIGFDFWVRVEAVGMSGGIWVLWQSSVHIDVTWTHPQFILLTFEDAHKGNHNIAIVYGSPSRTLRQKLWKDLGNSKGSVNYPWIALGDFNFVTSKEEVSNANSYSDQRSKSFNDWINDEGLIDHGYTGPRFTWTRGNNTNSFRGARLDRGLCSVDWLNSFPDSNITHLPAFSSDHSPIMLQITLQDAKRGMGRFHFQAAWIAHEDFKQVVERSWKKGLSLNENIAMTKEVLTTWNKDTFGNIHRNKRRLEARLEGIQRAIGVRRTISLIKLEAKLKKNLEDVLYFEELMWYQNSREVWIKSGDRNTNYYHATTKVRKATSRILALKNEKGDLEGNDVQIKNMIQNHFMKLYTHDQSSTQVCSISNGFPTNTNQVDASFYRTISQEEVKDAVFSMTPFKAPGPDGFHAGFYQNAWDVVGEDVTSMVERFIEFGDLQEGMNDTLITLIPKVKCPETFDNFRPISLCNVGYKIITKVITNRLKGILESTVGAEQCSFVPKRQITDNIAIFQETLHSMRSKKGAKGLMMVKIDLEKAYDRLSWSFIRETLQFVGLKDKWVDRIMTCI